MAVWVLGSAWVNAGPPSPRAGAGPAVTATPTSYPPFADNPPRPLACGAEVSDSTVGAPAQVTYYACRPDWVESGPEHLYALTLDADQPLTITLDAVVDLDLFLLSAPAPGACIAAGDRYLRPGEGQMPATLPAGDYYVVVDGYEGAAGAYRLQVECPLGPFATPTPTPTATPTPTPTATPTSTPTPTPTSTPTPTPLPYRQWHVPVTWRRYPNPAARIVDVVLQPGVNGYNGARDTYINAWAPSETYGDKTWISVRAFEIQVALLSFALQPPPPGAQLISARLRLNRVFQSNPNPITLRAYRLLRPWDEATASWRQAAADSPWAAAGGKAGEDYEALPAGEATVTADTDWVEMDVTKIVYAWQELGAPNYGIMIRGFGEGHVEYRFASREHPTVARHPTLILTYRLP